MDVIEVSNWTPSWCVVLPPVTDQGPAGTRVYKHEWQNEQQAKKTTGRKYSASWKPSESFFGNGGRRK